MRHPRIVIAGVLLLALAGVLSWRMFGQATAAEVLPEAGRAGKTKYAADGRRGAVRPPPVRLAAGSGAGDPSAPSSERLRDMDRMTARLDRLLSEERADPAWQRQLQERIAAHAGGQADLRLEALTCGSSVCRARFLHHTPEARRELGRRLSEPPQPVGEMLFDHGDGSTTVYFGQPNVSLTAVDP
jgi:hypothetical protein